MVSTIAYYLRLTTSNPQPTTSNLQRQYLEVVEGEHPQSPDEYDDGRPIGHARRVHAPLEVLPGPPAFDLQDYGAPAYMSMMIVVKSPATQIGPFLWSGMGGGCTVTSNTRTESSHSSVMARHHSSVTPACVIGDVEVPSRPRDDHVQVIGHQAPGDHCGQHGPHPIPGLR